MQTPETTDNTTDIWSIGSELHIERDFLMDMMD